MCVVVDANVRGEFLGGSKSAALLRDWLENGQGKLLHAETGDWLREHEDSSGQWQAQVVAYSQSGVLKVVADSEFASAEQSLPKKTKSGRKDRHVLALALAGGARLLYTREGKLQEDFKSVVSGGKVYPASSRESTPDSAPTVKRCREMLDGGGLCDHGGS